MSIQQFPKRVLDQADDLTVVWAVDTTDDGKEVPDSEHMWWKQYGEWFSTLYGMGGEFSVEPWNHPHVKHRRIAWPDVTVTLWWGEWKMLDDTARGAGHE